MALTLKLLAATQLTDTADTMLVPGSLTKSTLIKNIILVNTGDEVRKVRIKVKPGDAALSFYVAPVDLQVAPETQVVLDTEITLAQRGSPAAKDELHAWADAPDEVDCVINGLERDL